MSDSEATLAPLPGHRSLGGKRSENVQHAVRAHEPYKSWRKKYRKMKHRFDAVLDENKTLFKDEIKLEGLAKRLREELDGLLDICLDLNESPALPPSLRFNIQTRPRRPPPYSVDPNITPEQANALVLDYKDAVSQGRIPPLDLHVVREQVEQQLASQGAEPLDSLARSVQPLPVLSADPSRLPDDLRGQQPPAYLTSEQEAEYLLRLDQRLDDSILAGRHTDSKGAASADDGKHIADLTPRERERQAELLNPQSQHNWLKTHTKVLQQSSGGDGIDDNESLASHDAKPARKRGGAAKNLAKQVGDRAVERAREGWSPSAASAGFGDEDELSMLDDHPSSGGGGGSRKRVRDPDSTYRVKGGRSGGGAGAKSKRKRGGDDTGGAGASAAKRTKTEGES